MTKLHSSILKVAEGATGHLKWRLRIDSHWLETEYCLRGKNHENISKQLNSWVKELAQELVKNPRSIPIRKINLEPVFWWLDEETRASAILFGIYDVEDESLPYDEQPDRPKDDKPTAKEIFSRMKSALAKLSDK